MEKKAVVLDIASDFNRGDAIMQKAFGRLLDKVGISNVSGVGIYGFNEASLAEAHYDESREYFNIIHHGLRRTFNLSPKNKITKIKNLLSLFTIYKLVFLPFLAVGKEKKNYLKVLAEVESSDLVIWNGRNFRNRKGIGELYDLLCFIYLPLIVLFRTKKSILFYGVSVWSLEMSMSRWLVRKLLGNNRINVWAREDATHELLIQYGVENRRCMDLSFPILYDITSRVEKVMSRDIEFALTLTDWTEDGLNYRENYIEVLAKFIRNNATTKKPVYVLPQVYPDWESYQDILNEIELKVGLPGLIVSVEDKLSHSDLCEYYLRTKTVITTRMHGAIFATWCDCSVVSIAYDAGSKWHILKDLQCYDSVLNFTDLSYDNLVSALEATANRRAFDRKIIHDSIEEDILALKRLL